jgi:subtilisin family serine protease
MRAKLWILVSLGTSAAFGQVVVQPGEAPQAPSQTPVAAAGQYIVTFAPGTSRNDRANAAVFAGAILRYNYSGISAIAVTVPNENVLNALRANPQVIRITQDHVVQTQQSKGKGGGGGGGGGGGSTFVFDTQQVVSNEVQRVGPPTATSNGAGIGIAVLDTGIDFLHSDLAPSGTAFNALDGGSCQDDGGHGTHVSGMIAALNNEIGIVGVAPSSKLYCVKVLNASLAGSDATIMAGLDWVLTNHNVVNPPIRVVNMSLGRPLDTGVGETLDNVPMRALIQSLYNAGVVLVAAAGNDPALEVSSMIPAGFPEVISVSSTIATHGVRTCVFWSTTMTDVPADTASLFTTDGPSVTVAAPGEQHSDIVSLGSSGCVGLMYGTLSTTRGTQGATRKVPTGIGLLEARGTSYAAPLVTGTVARVLQMGLAIGTGSGLVEAVRNWIVSNADRKNQAPVIHPWTDDSTDFYFGTQSFDGVREGIVQAPK